MRKIIDLFSVFAMIVLCSCSNKSAIKQLDYSDFISYQIEWKNVFFTAKSHYFVYVYSETCGHCEQIKQQVLNYVDSGNIDTYLVHFTKDIPVKNDVGETIGSTSIENVWILGTPTLLEIEDKVLITNVAGPSRILPLLYL